MKEYASNYTKIQEIDGRYAISLHENELLKTPKGNLLIHPNESFIRHVISELEQFPRLKTKNGALTGTQLGQVTSYSLLAAQMDFVDAGSPPTAEDVKAMLASDPVLFPSAGPEQTDQYRSWEPIEAYLNGLGIGYFDLCRARRDDPAKTNSVEADVPVPMAEQDPNLRRFIPPENEVLAIKKSLGEYAAVVGAEWGTLTNPQKAVLNVLVTIFNSVLAAMAFLKGSASPSEYAHAVLAASPGHYTFGETLKGMSAEETHRSLYNEALSVARTCDVFLQYVDPSREVARVIAGGESKSVEFKSTLRWNIKAGRDDEAVTHASLKTVAAFLNSDGGTLLIGVGDDGKAVGIELDHFANDDKFLLHLVNVIKQQLGHKASTCIEPAIHTFEGKKVCMVKCQAGPEPVYLRSSNSPDGEYYVRTGPSTTKLSLQDAVTHIMTHFKTPPGPI